MHLGLCSLLLPFPCSPRFDFSGGSSYSVRVPSPASAPVVTRARFDLSLRSLKMSAYSVHPVAAPGSSTGPGFHHNQTSAFSAHHHPYGQASGSSAALHQPPSSGARGGAGPYGQQHHLHQQQPLQQIHLQQPPLPPPPHHQYQSFTNAVAYHQPSSQANSAQIHPTHHPYSQQTGTAGPAGSLATASALVSSTTQAASLFIANIPHVAAIWILTKSGTLLWCVFG